MIDQTNAKRASQGPQVTTQYRLAEYNVLAAFSSLADARKAMEALGRAGIEGKRITLGGGAADKAAAHTDTAAADSRIMTRWFSFVAHWAALGAVLGGVGGILVGVAIIAIVGGGITLGSL